MAKLIQCVPNFSEGIRNEVVKKIVDAISSASDVKVVDYSMDVDHNRSVVTFIGAPADIRKSMLAGAEVAVREIDLNYHKGEHPRIGAVDVIPVVPLSNISMDEAVVLSREIGADIANNLGVPVYFYENSATCEARRNLAHIRKGGFEALKKEALINDRKPDAGPNEVHPTAGATAVGARGPLIAYNVNLNTNNVEVAMQIATKIRALRDSGKALIGVKAIGVYLKSRDIAQVSTNITLPDDTSIYDVFSFVQEEASKMGVSILESELIGAMREEFLVKAAKQAMRFNDLTEHRLLEYWMREIK